VIISAEFVVNSKVYSIIKMFLFMANYRRELKMGVDIEKKKDGEGNRNYRKNE